MIWRALFVLWLASAPAWAVGCRLYLVSQFDWNAKQGFLMNLEADSGSAPQCSLGQFTLVVGAANGSDWRWVTTRQDWRLDKTYTARLVVHRADVELWLDDALIGRSSLSIAPHSGPLLVRNRPSGFTGQADFNPAQDSLLIQAGDKSLAPDLGASGVAPEVALFEGPAPLSLDWPWPDVDETVYTASFHFAPQPDLRSSSPMLDRFGQSRHADWARKLRSADDLAAANQEEDDRLTALGLPEGFNKWGGATTLGWQEEPSGFYRLLQKNGFWWLIDPEGFPVFYSGMCTSPALAWDMTPVSGRDWLFELLPPVDLDPSIWSRNVWGGEPSVSYVALHTPLLIERYGSQWKDISAERLVRRLRTWGFSGQGKWSDQVADLPIAPVLYYSAPTLAGHPDVFDDVVRAQVGDSLRKLIEPRIDDPRVLGWSIQNEIEGIVKPSEILVALSKGSAVPIKRAFVEKALKDVYAGDIAAMAKAWRVTASSIEDLYTAYPNAPDADLEMLRLFYESEYHRFLYETVKGIDPNHLYFGFWIVPGWWQNESDWAATAPYSDAIGYDRYGKGLTEGILGRLLETTDKPILLGEFSFPANYSMSRGFGTYQAASAPDDSAAGDLYAETISKAAAHPKVVGTMWFQYRDQPLTGRGPGSGEALVYGEHYAFGVVDGADRPKWDLVEKMRTANLAAPAARWALTSPPPPADPPVEPPPPEESRKRP